MRAHRSRRILLIKCRTSSLMRLPVLCLAVAGRIVVDSDRGDVRAGLGTTSRLASGHPCIKRERHSRDTPFTELLPTSRLYITQLPDAPLDVHNHPGERIEFLRRYRRGSRRPRGARLRRHVPQLDRALGPPQQCVPDHRQFIGGACFSLPGLFTELFACTVHLQPGASRSHLSTAT